MKPVKDITDEGLILLPIFKVSERGEFPDWVRLIQNKNESEPKWEPPTEIDLLVFIKW